MTDKPDGIQSEEGGQGGAREQFEHKEMTFEIHAVGVSGNAKLKGKFAAIVTDGSCPLLTAPHRFDTPEEAIAAGKALVIAKLSEKPSLWQKITWPAGFVVKLIFAAAVLIVLSVLSTSYKRKRGGDRS
jgi:hypothetical protein